MPQTVLITGCDSGIGLAAAKLFQLKGWNVAATMLSPDSDTGHDLAQLPQTLVIKLDVLDVDNIQTAVHTVISKFERIDLLVNNAGYGQYGLLEAVPRGKILAQFGVNVFGVIDMIKAVLPHFRTNLPVNGRKGTVLNVGSGSGLFCLPALAMYCSSKSALNGLTEAISYELSSQQISTKLVIPYSGVAQTSFHEHSASLLAADPSLSSYDAFSRRIFERYGSMASDLSLTSEDVAQCIFQAATDDSNQLRYYIGHDPLEMLKKKKELPEAEFTQFMKSLLR